MLEKLDRPDLNGAIIVASTPPSTAFWAVRGSLDKRESSCGAMLHGRNLLFGDTAKESQPRPFEVFTETSATYPKT